ncbi:hypothetical protein [Methylorubrum sp. SL192]|uniref:hypothetical protein n=1 Tax=Methylorubrum sp. SL192 TaxID=2995167 RepID=UPI0006F1D1C8|nr:hypothetical protein [Methylorubrum sp. SL192]KQO89444.1 hypothetical protein ASF33_19120 [Methylobacterium sp. Leaf92]MCY1644933.1 hypothetical protein [Methylorubrum sp. SL192]
MTRALIEAAFEDRDRMAAGWEPNGYVWADAPILNRWAYGVHPLSGTMALVGFLNGHPRTCSPVVAMLTGPGGIGWCRTLTGWLRLALTSDELHREGRHLLPAHARELELAAHDAGYRAPRRSLRPDGPIGSDPRWHEAADHIDKTAKDPELAFAVFYARQRRVPLAEARRAMEVFWLSRTMTFD